MSAKATHTVPPIHTLHDLVLDYIRTQAYFSTAQILARTPSPRTQSRISRSEITAESVAGGEQVRNGNDNGNGMLTEGSAHQSGNGVTVTGGGDMDMDLDNEGGDGLAETNGGDQRADSDDVDGEGDGAAFTSSDLETIERRRNIINNILNGAIMRAVEALNTHFPAVLAEDPAHRDGISIPRPGSYSNGSGYSGSGGHSHGHGHGHGSSYASASNGSYLATSPSSFPRSGSLPGSYPRRTSNGISHPTGAAGSSASASGSGSGFGSGGIPSDPPHALPTFSHSTHPSHVRLNLSIQAFIESFRQLAPSSPSSPASSIGSLTGSSMHLPSGSGATLTNALTAAQGLHQEAKKLPAEDRAVYLQEIKDVGALFAYSDPETSILKGFLDQGRRIALAEQVNRAILTSEGRQPKSQLEQCARRVTAMWAIMAERNIDPTPTWTAADGVQKEELALYLKGHSKRTFSLKDFARHSAT